jgi:hypothetical protein
MFIPYLYESNASWEEFYDKYKGILNSSDFISTNRRIAYLGRIAPPDHFNIMITGLKSIIFNEILMIILLNLMCHPYNMRCTIYPCAVISGNWPSSSWWLSPSALLNGPFWDTCQANIHLSTCSACQVRELGA